MKEIKNLKIKEKGKETRKRRSFMTCKTYTSKFRMNHLSKSDEQYINKLCLQSKWLYNYTLSKVEDLYNSWEKEEVIKTKKNGEEYKTVKLKNPNGYKLAEKELIKELKKVKSVMVKVKETWEERDISDMPSMIKGSVFYERERAIKSLAAKKTQWQKVWNLKYKQSCNSIELQQYNNTHRIINDKYIRVVGLWVIRVSWLKQFTGIKDIEYANARLVKKNKNMYFQQIIYQPKIQRINTGKSVGLDFGIETQLTSSDWLKFKLKIPESKQLKKLQRHQNKVISKKLNSWEKKIKTNNHFKRIDQINKEYEKVTNKRKDCINKIVSFLIKYYDIIAFQNEQISNWHKSWLRGFGRIIQNWLMGGIICKLKSLQTSILLDKFTMTSKQCSCCWSINCNLSLWNRIYYCSSCWLSLDRDLNAAINILQIRLNIKIPTELRNPMLLEINSSDILSNNWLSSVVFERRSLAL